MRIINLRQLIGYIEKLVDKNRRDYFKTIIASIYGRPVMSNGGITEKKGRYRGGARGKDGSEYRTTGKKLTGNRLSSFLGVIGSRNCQQRLTRSKKHNFFLFFLVLFYEERAACHSLHNNRFDRTTIPSPLILLFSTTVTITIRMAMMTKLIMTMIMTRVIIIITSLHVSFFTRLNFSFFYIHSFSISFISLL